jgi:predicted nucleotidyltransferase
MPLRDEIYKRRDEIEAIAHRHGARNLRLFGSVARGEERADSDVDLLIDLEEGRGFRNFLDLADELEALLGRRVDIITNRSLSRFLRPYIEAEAQPL